MLKRELNINFRSFLIWTLIPIAMLIIVFLVYPSIVSNSKNVEINEMLKMFPQQLLEAFNMDITGLNSVMGWFQSEGIIFILLIGSCYSSLLGGTILIKEESDKTIEFLSSKPISKNSIVTSKILCGIIYITGFTILVSLTSLIGFILSNDINYTKWALFSFAPIIIFYTFFFISLLISTYFNKTKRTTSISLAIVLLAYTFQTLSKMSDKLEFLKYFCPFELVNTRKIITDSALNINGILLGVGLCIISIFIIYSNYNKKELVI
jgi:ABC-2 type transport system permease protein